MKIKIKNIDAGRKSIFYNARNLNIQLTSKSIDTPIRALSNGELNAKAQIPYDQAISAQISGVHKELSNNETSNVLTSNVFVEKFIKTLENFRHRMQYSDFVFSLIQPANSAIEEHLSTDAEKDRFLRLILEIQKNARFSVLSVPWLNYSSSKKFIEISKAIEENYEMELIFFLNPNSSPEYLEDISKSLIALIETDRIHFLGLLNQPLKKTLVSYDTLWKFFNNQPVAVIQANVERYNQDLSEISSIHLNEFILGDIFLPKVRRSFSEKPKDENESEKTPKTLREKFRTFDEDSLTVVPINRKSDESWMNKIYSELPDPRIRLIIDNYAEAERNVKKFEVLNAISKVHEHIASERELERSQKYIENSESSVYIQDKDILNSALQKLKGKHTRQKSLYHFYT